MATQKNAPDDDDCLRTYARENARLHAINTELRGRIEDFEDDFLAVINEPHGAGGEYHCSCVPHLRRRIKELEASEQRDRRLIKIGEAAVADRKALRDWIRNHFVDQAPPKETWQPMADTLLAEMRYMIEALEENDGVY